MWSDTPIARRLGLTWPLLQAPMAGAATPELAAAVTNAGALGGLGLATVPPEAGAELIRAFRRLSAGPLHVNFFCHPDPEAEGTGAEMRERLRPFYAERGIEAVPPPSIPYRTFGEAHVAVIEDLRPEMVSFHLGFPDPRLFERVRATGAFIAVSANVVAEARWLAARGVDAVIAQGTEAGGHRAMFLDADVASQPGLFALVPQVASAVDLPVIAAGGIADGRGVAAALVLGAQAAQIGTAFLRCPEASVHPAHRAALAEARDDGTRVTRIFTGRPARALKNRLMEEFRDAEHLVAPYPAQYSLVTPLRTGEADAETLAMWAGQAAPLTREMPAAELVETLARETGELLRAVAAAIRG